MRKNRRRTYVGGFGFSIPAVAGVVSHLVVHVLSETQLVFGDTNFSKVEVDPPDEISQDGVIDHSLHEGEESTSDCKLKYDIPDSVF